MATDREIIKERDAGRAGTYGLAGKATDEVAKMNRRSFNFTKVGTENAETNVATTVMFTVRRKTKASEILYLTGTTTASDNTDYVKITVSKLTAGAGLTTVATYNTHGGAQGAITANVPASFSVLSNSDGTFAAGDSVHYGITKHGAGKVVAIGTFTVDGEEV
jgi:hypothetical protein